MQLPSGEEIPLPPIVLGRLGSDPGKKTVCIYGHLDVQPANIDDGWDTEPFTLVEKDGESRTFGFCLKQNYPEGVSVLFRKTALLEVIGVDWNSVLTRKTKPDVFNIRVSVPSLFFFGKKTYRIKSH